MLHSGKNDLLIGFIVSALLSLFVNFSMLMRGYDVINIQKNSALPEPQVFLNDYLFYFRLLPEGGYKTLNAPGYGKYLNNPANHANMRGSSYFQ